MERVYGARDDAAQARKFHASTDPASHTIVDLDGERVACLWVREHADALELVRLYVAAGVRNRGLGTYLVRGVLERARRSGRGVRLRVLRGNPARRLYERLGFVRVGGSATHDRMEMGVESGTVLAPMSAAEWDAFVARAVEQYALELVPVLQIPHDEALGTARSRLQQLLPRGRDTPGHHFRTIVDGATRVGSLWFAEQLDESPPRVFLYDIVVDDGHRGKGLGTKALRALEDEARRLGAESILLAVFAHNEGAIRLYERLGFAVCERGEGGMRMSKAI